MKSSAQYYRENPESRKKKNAYDVKFESRKAQVKKRVEANRARRKAKKAGKNINGKDYDHAIQGFISVAKNRGRKGEGGRKKKY